MRARGAGLESGWGDRGKGRGEGEGWHWEGCTQAHRHRSGVTPTGSPDGLDPLSNASW